ncbi:hypothetical protein KIH39_11340 [Telmatocola sphagniphila]|uniref:Uncharacterized protein n=1 Tax=Telmatocola sphagniphila TaxID=1123043 RepID=A0A8E6B961_9BACT|nr:hypothetical protein [Telmatocola sphagniphila]QVL34470.1 hypothetical protein KIH39_11340 [Telmatocola sphagniphila]
MRQIFLAFALFLVLNASAFAQYPAGPPIGGAMNPGFGQGGPTTSPYLNLLRGGSSTLANYYGLVRPELQFRQQVQGLATQQVQNTQAINGIDNVPITGNSIRFLNTQPYFMSLNRSGFSAGQGVVNNSFSGRTTGAINAGSPFGASGLNNGAARGSATRGQ